MGLGFCQQIWLRLDAFGQNNAGHIEATAATLALDMMVIQAAPAGARPMTQLRRSPQ